MALHEQLIQMGFLREEFTERDNSKKSSYKLLWHGNIHAYTFEVYYPREVKAGHIFIKYRTGSERNFHNEQIELPNLTGRFSLWLQTINEQKKFDDLAPSKNRKYSNAINSISPKFETIYLQAISAEKSGLDEICGMGYRKAFEFLLIDYLFHKNLLVSEQEARKFKSLQGFIELLKDDIVIHKLLAHTAWVGNEFCHYFRKWESKEVADLKEMIQIIVEWVDTKEKLIQLEEKSEIINTSFKK